MRIAPHHIVGTTRHDLSIALGLDVQYVPQCPWPEECTVQWGQGIVPDVPFFEAFPVGTFIRGEGATIAEAEQRAFAKYLRDLACSHVWGRHRPGTSTTYTNGAAFCRKCGGFRGTMFPEIKPSGWWRRPLTRMEMWHLESLEKDDEVSRTMDVRHPQGRAPRERIRRILRLRFNVFGAEASEG